MSRGTTAFASVEEHAALLQCYLMAISGTIVRPGAQEGRLYGHTLPGAAVSEDRVAAMFL